MLYSVKHLSKFKIEADDGSMGKADSFLFDDASWVIRYLVADTGALLPGRKVLIAPSSVGKPDGSLEVLPVRLTRQQIKDSPDIDAEKPVSRQQEIELHKHYNWVPYWGGTLGPATAPYVPVTGQAVEDQEDSGSGEGGNGAEAGTSLRRTKEVIGYRIHAKDGEIGHLDDFIVGVEDWMIRYIVVDIGRWLSGRKVLISPDWIGEISWSRAEVMVETAKEVIKHSPEFDPSAPVNREYETRLFDYYGRPKYWL